MSANEAETSVKRPRSSSPTSRAPADNAEPASKKQATSTDIKLEVDEEGTFNQSDLKPTDTASDIPPVESNASATNDGKTGGRQDKRSKMDKRGRQPWNPPAGRDSRKAEGGDEGEGDDVDADGKKRLPKKRVAVLLGYCGTGYQGMQIQKQDAKTIEGDFFEALVKAGAISAENATDHRKVDVQRSARTDAGVHAAGNVISLKMIYDPPLPDGVSTLTEHVNSFLPEQIRMWGFVRTMKSFQARTACDSRIYEYLLPSYCLLPPASRDAICVRLNESSPGWRDSLGAAAAFADETPEMEEAAEGEKLDPKQRGEYERRRNWRVDEGTLSRFRELVQQFQGTHNFHNYTVGKPFNDKTVKRYMISLEVRDPKVYGDIEWISVRIHGQSFMLHQIRKMISLAMLACRTGSPPSLLAETFGPKKIHIPKAPPLGLLLQQPQFKTYNDRIQQKVGGMQEDRDPVDFEQYAETMEAFKVEWIYEKLRQDELELSVYHKWIRQVDCSSSPAFTFLNKHGIIPPEATLSGKSNDARQSGEKKEDQAGPEEDSEDEVIDAIALKKGDLEG